MTLARNKFSRLPNLSKLSKLTLLDASHNEITSLPQNSEFSFAKLEKITLMSNLLSSIPEEIEKWTAVKELDLSSNQIVQIPETIGELENLEQLKISNNLLTSIPQSIGKLERLKVFEADENKVSQKKFKL